MATPWLAQIPWPSFVTRLWPGDHLAFAGYLLVAAAILLAYRPKRLEKEWKLSAAWTIGGSVIVIFLIETFARLDAPLGGLDEVALWLSLWPAFLLDGQMLWTPVTHMFVHADAFHALGNLIMFAIFFPRLEQFMGRRRITTIYLATGLAGAVSTLALYPDGTTPNLGASGAIYGLLGYFIVAFPKEQVPIPTPIIMLWVQAVWALPIYIVYNLLLLGTQVAWWAHLGGLGAGMLWALWHRKKYGHLVPHWRGRRNDTVGVSYRVR